MAKPGYILKTMGWNETEKFLQKIVKGNHILKKNIKQVKENSLIKKIWEINNSEHN